MPKYTLPSPPNPIAALWQELAEKDAADIVARSGAVTEGENLRLRAIGREFVINRRNHTIIQADTGKPAPYLLTLLILQYLLKSRDLPLSGRLADPHELTGGEFFFRGPHTFNLKALEERFALDREAFLAAGTKSGGYIQPLADTAFTIPALPHVPLTYTLWLADNEFPARIDVLFDSTAEYQLPLDMLWALVNITNKQLTT